MMHELGHAIGLQHEHARNDRNDFLDSRCENLESYEEAKRLVQLDERAHFEDEDELEDRLRLACAEDDITSDYLPAVVAFVRAKDHRLATEKRKWKYYKRSGPFDFDSIMIYNSFANPIEWIRFESESERIKMTEEVEMHLQKSSGTYTKVPLTNLTYEKNGYVSNSMRAT
jgi:hypothetical protein